MTDSIVAFRMQLKPGFEAEYQRRHDELWPELRAALTAAGIVEYRIFLDPKTLSLFAYQRLAPGADTSALLLTAVVVTAPVVAFYVVVVDGLTAFARGIVKAHLADFVAEREPDPTKLPFGKQCAVVKQVQTYGVLPANVLKAGTDNLLLHRVGWVAHELSRYVADGSDFAVGTPCKQRCIEVDTLDVCAGAKLHWLLVLMAQR